MELGLPDAAAYRTYLEAHPEEWRVLDALCYATVSRFYRDRGVFGFLEQEVLPVVACGALARGAKVLEAWSAGCASGEEPYTLAVMWTLAVAPRFPALKLSVVATDVDAEVLRRARDARYAPGSLRDLPGCWRETSFVRADGLYRLRPEYARLVSFVRHDIRTGPPDGPFDLVLCRNLAFTYFDPDLQLRVARVLAASLRPGGALVVGAHETLPRSAPSFQPWSQSLRVFRRTG